MSTNVLILHPDHELTARLCAVIQHLDHGANLGVATRAEDAITALEQFPDLDLCLFEVYFQEDDGLNFLSAIRHHFRRARLIVITSYNLENFAEHLAGLTIFTLPLDEEQLLSTLTDALQTLEGQVLPPYRLGKKQPPELLGDCYDAMDLGVKREVFITILPTQASAEESNFFRNTATLMARANHPNIQAVYQAGSADKREYFSREKWMAPSLTEMMTAGQGLDARLAAQVLRTIASVVIFWESNKYPHRALTPQDVSVSELGIIKIANAVDPREPVVPAPGLIDLRSIGHHLEMLTAGNQVLPLRLRALLDLVSRGPVALIHISSEAQAIDIELAPEQEMEITEERQLAEQEMEKEQRKQKTFFYSINAALGLFILVALYLLYGFYFAEPVSQDFSNDMVPIPGGPFVYQNQPDILPNTFYMDTYEVTFGDYLKFLRALQAAQNNDAPYRHPSQPADKNQDHQPNDWLEIYRDIYYKTPYHGEIITLDFPVFNVDWYDAEAYAKWKEKRLPTEKEWEKAASGPQGQLFPWGNAFSNLKANTAVLSPDDDGSTSHGSYHLPVDKMPQDLSPYGVYGLAGNVSEWTDTVVPSPTLSTLNVAVVRGGNFLVRNQDHVLSSYRCLDYVQATRIPRVGFRCVSDTPPAMSK